MRLALAAGAAALAALSVCAPTPTAPAQSPGPGEGSAGEGSPSSASVSGASADTTDTADTADTAADAGPSEPPELWLGVGGLSPCEGLCAQVHSCLLPESSLGAPPKFRDELDASHLELECLRTCIPDSSRFDPCRDALAPPGAAPTEDSDSDSGLRCAAFLECVDRRWTAAGDDPGGVDAPADGCAAACERYALCSSGDTNGVERCAQLCHELLPSAEQEQVGQCAKLEDCRDAQSCIQSFER